VGREVLGWDEDKVADRTRSIGDTLRVVFEDARANKISTEQAARDFAQRRIEAGADSLA
jgi:leucine dehydrogenase